ncbi:hypothetical protein SAY86_016112 [Trapa natans]|uniref:RING-type E3 ubiquitin transferase n=1 Tax=Trapa natans TaxID=22666 RepID=A0AAN7LBN8_TRANT|nr:hypothetical protein SAY86_016112 [Trapa natans]
MPGQKDKIVSLPETFHNDPGSSSSGASLDQQRMNEVRGQLENHFPGFTPSPDGSSSNGAYRALSSDWRVESGRPATRRINGMRIEDQQLGPNNTALSLGNTIVNPLYLQGAGSSSVTLNSSDHYLYPNRVNPSPGEHPNLHMLSGSNNNMRFSIPHGYQVDPSVPSGSTGYVVEGSEVNLVGSLDGRQIPCKRKAFEGHLGQSIRSSSWLAIPECFSVNGGPATQTHQEQVGARPGLNLAGGAVAQRLTDVERTSILQRNVWLRANSPAQRDTRPAFVSSPAMATARSPDIPSAPQSSSRLHMQNHSLEFPSPLTLSGSSPQELHQLPQVPFMAPSGHSVWRSRGTIPTNNSSPSSLALPEGNNSRGDSGNTLQLHHVFPPSSSSLTRSFIGARNNNLPETAASVNFSNSISTALQLPPHPQPTQSSHQCTGFPQRSSIYVHQQLSSVIGSDLGDQRSRTSNHASQPVLQLPSGPGSSGHTQLPRRLSESVQQLLSNIGSDLGGQRSQTSNSAGQPLLQQPSGPSSSDHPQSTSRSTPRMERQGDSIIRLPYQLWRRGATSRDRQRIASEDIMTLYMSMIHEVPDIQDLHWDMRLDVDNMSYEELLALEEHIGNVSTGLNEETILACMNQLKHSDMVNNHMKAEPCCICQEDYNDVEYVGILECGHDFHRDCIKKWLMLKNLCPICKMTGLRV